MGTGPAHRASPTGSSASSHPKRRTSHGTTTITVPGTRTVKVRVTSFTKIDDGSFTLNDGDAVEVKALVKDFRIVATKIEREDAEGEEDDD